MLPKATIPDYVRDCLLLSQSDFLSKENRATCMMERRNTAKGAVRVIKRRVLIQRTRHESCLFFVCVMNKSLFFLVFLLLPELRLIERAIPEYCPYFWCAIAFRNAQNCSFSERVNPCYENGLWNKALKFSLISIHYRIACKTCSLQFGDNLMI